jgi:hypothetical protein
MANTALILCLIHKQPKNASDKINGTSHGRWLFDVSITTAGPISEAARCKAWGCGRSLAGTAGSNSTGGHGCPSLVSVACCQVQVSATSRSLVQRRLTECGVSE